MMKVILSPYLLVFIVFALQPFTTCAEIYELQAVVGGSLDINCSPNENYEFWTDWILSEVELIPGYGFRIPKVTANLDGQHFGCHLLFNGVRYDNYTVWRLNVSESIRRNTSAWFSDTTPGPRKRVTREAAPDYTHTPDGIHKIHKQVETWQRAREICKQEGGDLAVINSQAESEVLVRLIEQSSLYDAVYIGFFNERGQKGRHVTIDGRSLKKAGYAKWGPNEPNNEGGKENCGSMRQDGKLNDVPCGIKSAFACELPLVNAEPLPTPKIIQGTVSAAIQGHDLRLQCQITVRANKTVELHWNHPKSMNDRLTYSKDPTLVPTANPSTVVRETELTVKDVKKTDSGQYTCYATSRFVNQTQSSIQVDIRDPVPLEDPVITHDGIPRNEVEILRATNLTLICEITVPEGDKFTLKWNVPTSANTRTNFYEDPKHLSNDTTLNRKKWKSELTISNVEVIDRDEYICVAKGVASNSSSSIKVLVWEPGKITVEEGPRVNLSQSATLSCRVDGYPLSNITWVKINGTTESKPSGIQNLLSLNPSNTSVKMSLSFTRVTREDNGTYECKAITHNETFTSRTSLIVTEKPDVEIRRIGAISSDTVYLKWIIHDWNEPVKRYHIQQMKEDTRKWENDSEVFDKESPTKFELEGLEGGVKYQFRITVENAIGVSQPADSRWIKLPSRDAKVESFDPKLEVERTSNTTLKLRWTSLPEPLKELIDYYNLSAIHKGKVDKTEKILTNETTYEFRGLIAGAEYLITISACNSYTKNCTAGRVASDKDAGFGLVGLFSGLGVALVVFVVMSVLMCIWKKRDLASRRRFIEATLVRFRIGAVGALNPNIAVADQSELLPYDKKWEFPRKKLTLGRVLGSGAFGIVRKGHARSIRKKNVITPVAVKMVRATHRLEHMTALTRELKILAHLGKHLNIVNLLGACSTRMSYGELFMIVEFCSFGNLHDYLLRGRDDFVDQVDHVTGNITQTSRVKAIDSGINTACSLDNLVIEDCDDIRDAQPTDDPASESDYIELNQCQQYQGDFPDQDLKPIATRDLLSWAWQVSRGMKFLTSRRVVHGDLATRNILLTGRNVVKICDFGLAKSLYADDIYKKEGNGPLPIKWMAIESIRDRVFSIKSDVWSFGVVLWEFFTLAETPYPGIANEDVYQKLINGFRMKRPKYSTKEIYHMMLRCWDAEPSKRPPFGDLEVWIEDLLEEEVKTDYVDFDAAYAKLNAEAFADGKVDYLTMGPPEAEFTRVATETPPGTSGQNDSIV